MLMPSSSSSAGQHLHIPAGIRFQCSGCGNCCLTWPVPLTASDQERIAGYQLQLPVLTPVTGLFRALPASESKQGTFAYSLQKGADGRCPFLSSENRCQLHSEFGERSKPAMCQLFPHTFTLTPAGVYTSVSFASTAVLYNSGSLLSEQEDLLSTRFDLFRQLYPQLQPEWTNLRWLDTHPATWQEFCRFDELALERAVHALSAPGKRLDALVRELSAKLMSFLPPAACDMVPPLESPPALVDKLLLAALHSHYLPEDQYASAPDFDARALMQAIVQAPEAVSLRFGQSKIALDDLAKHEDLGSEAAAIDDLLKRFFYCRLFAKLYFGNGLGGFSIVSGFHHLCLLLCVLQLQMKAHVHVHGTITFAQAAEYVRIMERRLTFLNLSPQAAAVLEILCMPGSRIERTAKFCRTRLPADATQATIDLSR